MEFFRVGKVSSTLHEGKAPQKNKVFLLDTLKTASGHKQKQKQKNHGTFVGFSKMAGEASTLPSPSPR